MCMLMPTHRSHHRVYRRPIVPGYLIRASEANSPPCGYTSHLIGRPCAPSSWTAQETPHTVLPHSITSVQFREHALGHIPQGRSQASHVPAFSGSNSCTAVRHMRVAARAATVPGRAPAPSVPARKWGMHAAGVEAVVNEVVQRGVVDPARIAAGGHSYGAFMTANILAHCGGLFACGIAQSGAYNRTLTPFGFQAEQRTFWKAPEVYSTMAPFNNADKIQKPLLLIHGEADNNTGAFRCCIAWAAHRRNEGCWPRSPR